jgi:hypothetical protein
VLGLTTFMSSIGLRAWIQFGDTMDHKMAKAFALLTGTFIMNMVAYFHHSITRFHLGLPGLLVRFLYVYLQVRTRRARLCTPPRTRKARLHGTRRAHLRGTVRACVTRQHFGLVGVASAVSVGACVVLVAQVAREQLVRHGTPTGHLSVQQLPQRSPPPSKLPSTQELPQRPPPILPVPDRVSWRDWSPMRGRAGIRKAESRAE